MSETQSPPLSEAEKLDAALDSLLAERNRRREATGKLAVVPMVIVDDGKLLADDAATEPQRFEYPPEGIEIHVVDPAPQVEAPSAQWDQPVNARDVTPFRPPLPTPSTPPPSRPEPRSYSNAGVPREVYEAELKRLKRFLDGDWDVKDGPLRYPRGRHGW